MTASASVRKGSGCILLTVITSTEALQGSTIGRSSELISIIMLNL